MYIVRYKGTDNEFYLAVFDKHENAKNFARIVSGYIITIVTTEIYSEKGFERQ